jgi:hypothetical protein
MTTPDSAQTEFVCAILMAILTDGRDNSLFKAMGPWWGNPGHCPGPLDDTYVVKNFYGQYRLRKGHNVDWGFTLGKSDIDLYVNVGRLG